MTKTIEITLTEDQFATIEGIAELIRSNPQDTAKAYLLEGVEMLTSDPTKTSDDMAGEGLECLRAYVDKNLTPESAFAPTCEASA